MDLNNKKSEMEREFIELNKRNLVDIENQRKDDMGSHQKNAMERELFESEKIEL